jgi:hypothetical protein
VDAVEAMVARCHDGPPAALVDAVHATVADLPEEAGFRQLPTV